MAQCKHQEPRSWAALGLMLWVFLIYCVLTSAWAKRSSTVSIDFLRKLREKGKENEERRDPEGGNEGREKGKIRRQYFRLLVLQQSACRLADNQQLSSK